MKILVEIAIIFSICLLAEFISLILPFSFPSAIIAMLLLLALLFLKIIKEKDIESFSSLLLKNMAFFFVPAGVKVIEHLELIKTLWLPFLAIGLISAMLVFITTTLTVNLMLKIKERKAK